VVVTPPVDTIFDFLATYRSKNLPLKYKRLVLLPFGQHSRLTADEQDWADKSLVNGEFCEWWIMWLQRSTYFQSGFFVVFPDSRHSLMSSEILGTHILWRLQSVCRLIFPHGSANQCQLHYLSNRLDVLVAPIRSFHSNVLFISPALGFCWLIVPRSWLDTLWFERSSNVIQVLVKFTRVLNTPMSLNLDWSLFVELPCFFSEQTPLFCPG
jgi:hypothetical protein